MKISEAAKLLGISTDTIRYYEKEGVIYPKRISQNNYRDLDNKDVISYAPNKIVDKNIEL